MPRTAKSVAPCSSRRRQCRRTASFHVELDRAILARCCERGDRKLRTSRRTRCNTRSPAPQIQPPSTSNMCVGKRRCGHLTYHGSVAGPTHNGPRLKHKQFTHEGRRSNAAGGYAAANYIEAVIFARKCPFTQKPRTLIDTEKTTDTHRHPAALAASDKTPTTSQAMANLPNG